MHKRQELFTANRFCSDSRLSRWQHCYRKRLKVALPSEMSTWHQVKDQMQDSINANTEVANPLLLGKAARKRLNTNRAVSIWPLLLALMLRSGCVIDYVMTYWSVWENCFNFPTYISAVNSSEVIEPGETHPVTSTQPSLWRHACSKANINQNQSNSSHEPQCLLPDSCWYFKTLYRV